MILSTCMICIPEPIHLINWSYIVANILSIPLKSWFEDNIFDSLSRRFCFMAFSIPCERHKMKRESKGAGLWWSRRKYKVKQEFYNLNVEPDQTSTKHTQTEFHGKESEIFTRLGDDQTTWSSCNIKHTADRNHLDVKSPSVRNYSIWPHPPLNDP